MSRYNENFEQENNEPVLEMRMNFNGESIELRLDWENTCVFTHREQDSHYDHIFVQMEDEDDSRCLGAFIWRQVLPDWDDLKKALDDRDYQHVHVPYPSPMDCEQYELTGLTPPTKEVQVTVEAEDDEVVEQAMANIDAELKYFLGEADE
jgi:hypothetical protein